MGWNSKQEFPRTLIFFDKDNWKKNSVFNMAFVHRLFSIFSDKSGRFVSLHLKTFEFLIKMFISEFKIHLLL